MANWLPALKAVLPYVTNIVTATVPAFTSRKDADKNADLVAQQIAELQSAAQQNAESIRALAEQLKQTIQAVEAGAAEHERVITELRTALAAHEQAQAAAALEAKRLRQQCRWLAGIAVLGAAFALAVALTALGQIG